MPTLKMPEVKGTGQPTVLRWCKAVGGIVAKGEVLLQVETDDQLIEVESSVEGALQEILAPAGTPVPPQTPLAVLGAVGAAAPVAPAGPPAPAAQKPAAPARAPGGPVTPIVMPKAGQSMEEGSIIKWNVKPGDRIKKGQVTFVIETDKATVDVEAVDEGRLARIVVPQGETVLVQVPVAYLAENDADVDIFIAQQDGAPAVAAAVPGATAGWPRSAADTAPPAVRTPAVAEGGRVKASPAARKLAQQRGVNLAAVGAGSGPGGRILSTDVAAARPGAAPPAAASAGPAPAGGVRKKMSQMRKAVARHLLFSKQNIPHFYLNLTVNAEPMFAFYRQEKAKYPCSVNDVVLASVAKAVGEFPQFRCRMENNELFEYPTANIGVAVGMDEGLAVPVIVAAEKLSLQQIGAEAKRLAEAARKGKVEHMGEGVFTVTNLGMFGIEEFMAIINPPEAAILAVGAAHDALVAQDGAARVGKVMTMTLSVDHRVIDGMVGAKFLARLKELLENPAKLV
ncbi:MAG: 2-oxo acid dehydrogenase subunit E2 [Planctomycetota bacterium]|nr:2-oxo acid dehydrogenase subunit E2 [Planctomycetota bacterium]